MKEFINVVLLPILGTALTAMLSYVGLKLKAIYERAEVDKTKKAIAKTCVQAVEQLYTELHGAEKFYKAVEAMTEMLNDRGITVSEIEIKMLIESAVQQLNASFGSLSDFTTCEDCMIDFGEEQ